MGIVRFALKFPYTFYVLAAFIVFLGVSAIWVMPEDIFPEINIPVVSVIWQYTGLSVPEMEQRVTTYSQYAMSSNVWGRHILFGSRKKGPVQCLGSRGAAGENPSLRPPNNATTSRSWWV